MTTPRTRYFLSYTGVTLPLKLTGELQAADLRNRNTRFEARHDEAPRVIEPAMRDQSSWM
jgi:hypothetical protein